MIKTIIITIVLYQFWVVIVNESNWENSWDESDLYLWYIAFAPLFIFWGLNKIIEGVCYLIGIICGYKSIRISFDEYVVNRSTFKELHLSSKCVVKKLSPWEVVDVFKGRTDLLSIEQIKISEKLSKFLLTKDSE